MQKKIIDVKTHENSLHKNLQELPKEDKDKQQKHKTSTNDTLNQILEKDA